MVRDERLLALFRAFSERQDSTFLKIADAIIAEELAANHHSQATELRKALEPAKDEIARRRSMPELLPLPKDRRNGEQLIRYLEPTVTQEQIILGQSCGRKIARILEEHQHRRTLAKHGYIPKRKLLFWGPPGCGKTFAANFVAHELGIPLGIIRLNAIISSFLGDTAAHIQRVFDVADSRPMVLLLDEIDAVAKDRDDRNDVGELKRIVNSLLQAMDAFASTDSVIIAASNHQYLLDPAIWRRFDEIVQFPLPQRLERGRYLKILLNGISFTGSPDQMAKNLSALSYADIKKVVVEAVKSVILRGDAGLKPSDVLAQLHDFRSDLTGAKTRIANASIRRKTP